ncbi:choice-of-anchor A domain-containing protein [Arthrobacter stackebrandtii]|uniref:Choice-of-anchor A domain-containing protein n=1 Tax=Arthrobacter stackebrandtii TaxID=272161 RepID=A0ABS4YX93_9MICC|nr:choice-of-anchor A family protein [Arthrobacter stackebrandtii]MBP2413067.1 choice-of-anchor A domain-containing protein [Arthrobacter stackebrandtii]
MTNRISRRPGKGSVIAASALTAALTLGSFLALVPAANAEGGFTCIEEMPGLGNGDFAGFDNNTSVFVGGNFSVAEMAAEAEGLLVVMGDAEFAKAERGNYNVGIVGVGSQIVPTPGSDMLLVGGSVSSNGTVIDVGNPKAQLISEGSPAGGAVRIGGSNNAGDKLSTNGGTLTVPDATAVAGYAGFSALLKARSEQYSGLEDTGTVEVESWGEAVLTGDGVSSTQVFTVDEGFLGSEQKDSALQFKDVPADARIVVNVKGEPAGLFLNTLLNEAGLPVLPNAGTPDGAYFGSIASRLVWNFADAKNVAIGGTAQVPGSILVPTAGGTTEISAPGTNGRILVAGNLVHSGTGTEMHAYPLMGDEDFGCSGKPAEKPEVPLTPLVPVEPVVPGEKPEVPLTPLVPVEPVVPGEKPEVPLTPLVPVEPVVPGETPVVPLTPLEPADPVVPDNVQDAPAPSTPASAKATAAPSASESPKVAAQASDTERLANTGLNAKNTAILGVSALLLLALGGLAVVTVRRRH